MSKRIPHAVVIGTSMIGLGISHNFFLSLGLMFLAGWGTIAMAATCNTIIQLSVPDVLRSAIVREQSAELEIWQGVNQLCECHGTIAGRDAAARYDRHIDHHVRSDTGLARGRRQRTRVILLVYRLDELLVRLAQLHRAFDLAR